MPRNPDEEFDTWANSRVPEFPQPIGIDQLKEAYTYGVFIGTPPRDYASECVVLSGLAQKLLEIATDADIPIPISLRVTLENKIEYYAPPQSVN